MVNGSASSFGRRATPVSADDIARVVRRALADRTDRPGRIRLTAGQRGAILRGWARPGAARA